VLHGALPEHGSGVVVGVAVEVAEGVSDGEPLADCVVVGDAEADGWTSGRVVVGGWTSGRRTERWRTSVSTAVVGATRGARGGRAAAGAGTEKTVAVAGAAKVPPERKRVHSNGRSNSASVAVSRPSMLSATSLAQSGESRMPFRW
jgi:hypothetical protein